MLNTKEIQKVLLVLPQEFKPTDRPAVLHLNPPLGIGYIAAALENEGYDVSVIDSVVEGYNNSEHVDDTMVRIGISDDELRGRIQDIRPDVVGISSMFTMQRRNTHRVAEIVKNIDSEIPVIVGGAHPTAAPDQVLADENVDIVVLSEGDNSIGPVIDAFKKGAGFKSLDGVAYRGPEGIIIQEKRNVINDLDILPFPARHLLPMEKYLEVGARHGGALTPGTRPASLISSRGCQFRCNFCTAFKVFGRLPRVRSIDSVMSEIDELVNDYGVNWLFFEDDQLIAKVAHAEALFDAIIERNYGISWDTPNGVSAWLLNEKLLHKMAKSGCTTVNLALESGNQYVLDKIINKPVKLHQIPPLVETIRKTGMEIGAFLVVGNFSDNGVETLDQIRDSFRMARALKVTPNVSYLAPYPGSDVLNIAQKKGYLIDDFDWDKCVCVEINVTTPEWTPEQLRQVVEEEMEKTVMSYRLYNTTNWLYKAVPRLILEMKSNPIKAVKLYSKQTFTILINGIKFLFSKIRKFINPATRKRGKIHWLKRQSQPTYR